MPPRRAIRGPQEPSLDHILERNIANVKQLKDEFRLVPDKIRNAFFYLLHAVADPLNTKACPATLVFALSRTSTLLSEPGFQDNASLSKLHGFWSILYNFLIAERTDEQFASLVSQFATCSCDVENSAWYVSKDLHREAKRWDACSAAGARRPRLSLKADRSNAWAFIHMLGGLLRVMMSSAKDASVTKGVSKRWPSKTSELLPLGPDQVVKSLIQWHRFVGDMVMRELLPGLLKMCGPLIHHSITKFDALNILVLEPIKSQLDKVLNILEVELAATTTGGVSQLKDYQLDQLGEYLRKCIREVLRPPARSGVLMLDAGGATKALQLCSIILYTIPLVQPRSSIDPGYFAFLTQHLSHFGSQIFNHFNLHLPDRPIIPLHPSLVAAAQKHNNGKLSMYAVLSHPSEDLPSHHYIASAMVECRSTRSCSGPGCELTFKDKGSSYKTCARCTTVGYCGRECQLRHWNADNGDSHKGACKVLAKILKERGGWKESTNSDRRLYSELMDLTDMVAKMQEEGTLSRDDVIELMVWAERSSRELNDSKYVRLEWHSGYDDYDDILARLVVLGGPKPEYIDRMLASIVKGDQHLMEGLKDSNGFDVHQQLHVLLV